MHCLFTIGAVSETPPTLGDVLSFFTAEEVVPPMGYATGTLNFNYTNIFPTASTCAILLTLPTMHGSYLDFKNKLDIAFTWYGGFGLT